jgi:hypothetical protein
MSGDLLLFLLMGAGVGACIAKLAVAAFGIAGLLDGGRHG